MSLLDFPLPLPYYNYTSEEDKILRALQNMEEYVIVGNKGKLYYIGFYIRHDWEWSVERVTVAIRAFPSLELEVDWKIALPFYYRDNCKVVAQKVWEKILSLDISSLELYK